MTEVWSRWEGQVVNGVFPLRCCLRAHDQSAVFLTEHRAQNGHDAALRLIPSSPTSAEAQLSYWTATAALSHPHLIRLFDAGRCQLEGDEFLFLVMEFAEQSLSQILPSRALTPGEVREMLPPTLNALDFLHARNLVQGRLRPSNILVVADQVKLASDSIRPAGAMSAAVAERSAYDPPEARAGGFSAAGDVWALGVTLVEALTQRLPSWPDQKSEFVMLPPDLPEDFALLARQCLDRNPDRRPSVAALQRWLEPPRESRLPSPSNAALAAPKALPRPRAFIAAIVGLLVVAAAVLAGLHALNSPSAAEREVPSEAVTQNPTAPPQPETPAAGGRAAVLHEEIPDVPPHARATIRGRIKVAIRVSVDRSGTVINETLETRGSSQYFTRLAMAAAKQWKFAASNDQKSRSCLLRFEFARDGVTGHAANTSNL
jgi:hypothetical protein